MEGNSAQASDQPTLSLNGAWKTFGHVVALSDVSLSVNAGEILAVVGDNGAGKSTLIKCLSGMYPLDAGTLAIQGHSVKTTRAIKERVGVVYQELAVVDTLDVATNLYLEDPIRWGGIFINRRAMNAGAVRAFEDLHVVMPSVRIPVGELSGGQRQAVAIARVLRRDCPILMFDEPTAALGVRETATVADILCRLRDQGKAIVLVSHDLDLVHKCSDRIHIMRLGRSVGVLATGDAVLSEVIGLLAGAGTMQSPAPP